VRALEHAGMADEYLATLKPWRDLLPLHFSTWPATPGKTRSDSHAWSAHPIYDLLTLVAGIEPASPGFGDQIGWAPPYLQRFPNPTLERMVKAAPSLSVCYLGGLPPGK
jgi:hypothetical protein